MGKCRRKTLLPRLHRKEKGAYTWFFGAITDENKRTLEVPLNFLDKDRSFEATISRDGPNAHWQDSPTDFVIESRKPHQQINSGPFLAPGGGTAISFDVL